MQDPLALLKFIANLLWVLPLVVLFAWLQKGRAKTAAWEQSPAGQRHAEAMASFLSCKARVERAEPTGEGMVTRVVPRRKRMAVREERLPMRLQVRLLPIGGDEVVTEGVVPIIHTEVAELTPGKIFTALYDPRDPTRFFVDTLRRDESLIDAVTMRTRAAEDNHRAAQAFSRGQG